MKMKQWIALLLAALVAFAMAGCNNGENGDQPIDVGPSNTPGAEETPNAGLNLAQPEAPIGMVAAGSVHSVGLRADGTAVSAGHDTVGQRDVSDWKNVVFIAAGEIVTAGVTAEGGLLLAGDGTAFADSASWEAAAAWTDLSSVAVGGSHIVGLKADGTAVAVGDNSAGQCDVSGWSNLVAVAAGDAFTLGLTASGTLVSAGTAPDVSAWKDVTAISAGGEVAAALTNTGTALVSNGADVSTWNGLAAVAAGAFGVVGVKADGTVVAALSDTTVDLSSETNVVAASVGAQHVVLMHRDGTAAGYGVNDDLQCAVDRFFLRPHVEDQFLIGFRPGMTIAEATPVLKALTGSETAFFAKEDGTAAAETDLIATGLSACTAEGTPLATVVLMGDVNGDGAITEDDAQAIMNYLQEGEQLSVAAMRAARACDDEDWAKIETFKATLDGEEKTYYTYTDANRMIAGVNVIRAYAAGTGTIAQYGDWNRATTTEESKFEACYAENEDTVGYIVIEGTNIDYPIMFDSTGKWYYNNHSFEKEEKEAGSVYAYYYGYGWNNAVTGHNSRPSGSMFHQLHHLQEFNLGETNCLQKKYCDMELADLPDFNVYANRVWTVNLYGVETRYEIFAMYETEAGVSLSDTLYDNAWWGSENQRTTEEGVQEWIDKQLELSEFAFNANVSPDNTFLTIFTCGNEKVDADEGARLYFFLHRVD